MSSIDRILAQMVLQNFGGSVSDEEMDQIREEWGGIDRFYVALAQTQNLQSALLRGDRISVTEFLENEYGLNEFEKSSLAHILHTTDLMGQMGMSSLAMMTLTILGISVGRQGEFTQDQIEAANKKWEAMQAANKKAEGAEDQDTQMQDDSGFDDPNIVPPRRSAQEEFEAPIKVPEGGVSQPNREML